MNVYGEPLTDPKGLSDVNDIVYRDYPKHFLYCTNVFDHNEQDLHK